MKKLITVALIGVMIVSFAFAAGGNQANSKKTTLTFYSWAGGGERTMLEAVARDFEAANPDIRIEQNHGGAEYLSRINTLVASGTAPDVFQINEFLAIDWGERGVAEDLYPYYARAGIVPEDLYINSYLFRSGGHLWAVGAIPATMMLYYNRDVFRKAGVQEPPASAVNPWTWEQFVDAAKKMTKDSNGRTPYDSGFNYNSVVQWGTVVPASYWIYWIGLIYAAGTSIVNDAGTGLAINSPNGIRAVQSMANLALVDRVAPGFATTISPAFSNLSAMLMNEQLAMYINGSWDHGSFLNEGFDVGLAQLPTFVDRGHNFTWAAGYILKKGGSDEAFKFFEYLMDFNNWVNSAINNNIALPGGIPTTQNTFTDPVLNARWLSVNDPTIARVGGDIIQNTARLGENVSVKNWAEIMEQTLHPGLQRVWMGEETAEQALQTVNSQLTGKFQGVYK